MVIQLKAKYSNRGCVYVVLGGRGVKIFVINNKPCNSAAIIPTVQQTLPWQIVFPRYLEFIEQLKLNLYSFLTNNDKPIVN